MLIRCVVAAFVLCAQFAVSCPCLAQDAFDTKGRGRDDPFSRRAKQAKQVEPINVDLKSIQMFLEAKQCVDRAACLDDLQNKAEEYLKKATHESNQDGIAAAENHIHRDKR